jgi:hypothetical protein
MLPGRTYRRHIENVCERTSNSLWRLDCASVFAMRSVDARFFESAPVRLKDSFEVDRPASHVWAELTADDTLAWCRALKDIRWTSPRPFGVGTTRVVRTRGALSVFDESFFRWEEGARMSFYVVRSRLPGFRSFAEDYLVEPISASACRFSWTIAYEPQGLARLMNAPNGLLLATVFSDTRRHYGVN